MHYHKITGCDTANGLGIRVTLWVSGCVHHCRECHNIETWDLESGNLFESDTLKELLELLDKPYIKGLTLSGGDPLHPNNLDVISIIVSAVKSRFPNKDIWCYTGYNLTDLLYMRPYSDYLNNILNNVDYIVDGPYIKELKDVKHPFAGSSNQVIWHRTNMGEWEISDIDKEYRDAKSNSRVQE